MEYAKRIIIFGAVGCAVAVILALALAGCARGSAPFPQTQPTGKYSPVSGHSCQDTGPGWLSVPEGAAGQVFHVKNAHYCAGSAEASVIPVSGKPFNLYIPFWFSKTDPEK